MRFKRLTSMVVIGSMGLAPLAGCESLPGGEKEQGAVIGLPCLVHIKARRMADNSIETLIGGQARYGMKGTLAL